MIEFRKPRPSDIKPIAQRMSEIDVRECAAVGLSPRKALQWGYRQSGLMWTGVVDGQPEAMFGVVVASMLTGEGRPWMLGTDNARKNARAFLEVAPEYLAMIEDRCPRLENMVHVENKASIRWLKRLGFVFDQDVVDMGGEPMLRFWRHAACASPPSLLELVASPQASVVH